MVDIISHLFIVGFLIVAIYFIFSPDQAAVSLTAGLIGGLYFQSTTALYVIFFLVIPELLLAIVFGWFLGTWLVDD